MCSRYLEAVEVDVLPCEGAEIAFERQKLVKSWYVSDAYGGEEDTPVAGGGYHIHTWLSTPMLRVGRGSVPLSGEGLEVLGVNTGGANVICHHPIGAHRCLFLYTVVQRGSNTNSPQYIPQRIKLPVPTFISGEKACVNVMKSSSVSPRST